MCIYTHSVYWIHLSNHSNIQTEGYIGVSNDAKRRFLEHIRSISESNVKNSYFISSLKKYKSDIVQTIIYQGTEESCYDLEEELRPNKNIGWNVNCGGIKPPSKIGWKASQSTLEKRSKSLSGIPRTESWRKNLSKSKIGNQNGMYGKTYECSIEKKLTIKKSKNKDKLAVFSNAIKLLNDGIGVREVGRRLSLNPSVVSLLKNGTHGAFDVFPELKKLNGS